MSDEKFGSEGGGDGADKSSPDSGNTAPDEFRYEGPITFDDEEFDEDYEEGSGRRTFLTTAIIFAAVVIIVFVALMMRSDSGAKTPELTELSPPPPAMGSATGEEPAGGLAVAEDSAVPRAGEERAASLDYRAVPDTPTEPAAGDSAKAGETTPPPEPAATPAPLVQAPPPRETSMVESPAKAPKKASRARSQDPAEVARLAREGWVSDAADLGTKIARSGNPADWTLQVLLACQPDTVSRAFKAVDDRRLTVLHTRYQGKGCYRLCWGDFPTRQGAEQAAPEVPAYFRSAGKPRPTTWGEILR